MNLFLRIGSLVLSPTFLCPSDIGNIDISSCPVMVGRPCPTNFWGTSRGYCANGRPLVLLRSSLCFFFFFFFYDPISVVHPFDLV